MNEDYEEKNLESVGLPVPLGNHCGRRLVVDYLCGGPVWRYLFSFNYFVVGFPP